jgi:hypothetical protein
MVRVSREVRSKRKTERSQHKKSKVSQGYSPLRVTKPPRNTHDIPAVNLLEAE